jgi:glycosyltransferase involved in cell wall biosynthesis
MPEVTVLMSVYNGLPFLAQAVESILQQTFSDFTLLVIDDGSTDGSDEYLDQLCDPRVQIIHQSHRGLGAALNQGLAVCRTEFLARMDADDVALPSRLEAQLAFLRCHQEIGMLGTQIVYLGVAGRSGFSPPMPCDHEAIYADLLRGRLALCHPSIMCRTSILKELGGYRIDGIGEDWDLFLRTGEATRLANLDQVLHLYRVHSSSVNVTHLGEVRTQVGYACHCARLRAERHPEISFGEYVARQCARPFWQRAADRMDCSALGQYRRALSDVLSEHRVKGYTRLAWAALCSPRWTAQRITRMTRRIALRRDRGASTPFIEV